MAKRSASSSSQEDFFDAKPIPAGFLYQPEALSDAEAQSLVAAFAGLDFKPFEFHGYLGKRRIVSFGWQYEYGSRALRKRDPIPDFLGGLRDKAQAFAGSEAPSFEQVLVTEYAGGAGIGWHRDKAMFEDVVAFSFLAPCLLRFRRKDDAGWERASVAVQPRSAYLLRGPARREWEHSVPPVAALRYSVTFRNFTSETRAA